VTQNSEVILPIDRRILIICVGLAVFSPCLFDFFVSDDFLWIKGGLDLHLADLLHGAEGSTYNIFRPLIPVTFSVLHRLFGLAPFGYHLTSISLHIANALLFYHILLRLVSSKEIAIISALLFISHFAHEETVFWISSVCVLSCWFFCLLSILMFLNWLRDGRGWVYFLCLGSGLVAPFFREDALILLPILSGIVWLKYSPSNQHSIPPTGVRTRLHALAYLLPFVAALFAYYYLRSVSLPHLHFGDLFSLNPTNIARNLLYFSVNLTLPIRPFFDAVGYHYSRIINSEVNSIDSNPVIVMFCLLAMVILALIVFNWVRKKDAGVRLLIVISAFTLLPSLAFRGYGLRFTYLPLLGFTPVAGHALVRLAKRIGSRQLRLGSRRVSVALLIVLSINVLVLMERHWWWKKASIISQETVLRGGNTVCSSPPGYRICFVNLPRRSHGAYIFGNGFAEAVNLFYPSCCNAMNTFVDENVPALEADSLKDCRWYRYENGEFHRVF
jgi:hypothetical protein